MATIGRIIATILSDKAVSRMLEVLQAMPKRTGASDPVPVAVRDEDRLVGIIGYTVIRMSGVRLRRPRGKKHLGDGS